MLLGVWVGVCSCRCVGVGVGVGSVLISFFLRTCERVKMFVWVLKYDFFSGYICFHCCSL